MRNHRRWILGRIREEQDKIAPEYMETVPVFDQSEEQEWMTEVQQMRRIKSPSRKYRHYTDDLEMLFQGDLLSRILGERNGDQWLEEHLGIPRSTSRGWHKHLLLNPTWRPWNDPRKGKSMKLGEDMCREIRAHLEQDLSLKKGEVTSKDILAVMQQLWSRSCPGQEFPDMSLETVRRMMTLWGWSWRRAHKKRRPDVDPAAAARFVQSIMELQGRGVNPGDVVNGDESAFLMYPQGFYTWARRGTEAVQIQVAGNEKQAYTVMVAVTMDNRKLPLFTIVKGKTRRAEKGLALTTDSPHKSSHSSTGWQITETMLQWLLFLRSLPEYADGHEIHVILDCFRVHICEAVRREAARLNIRLHFIPPGLTDLLQPLDRAVFGALKAEYRAIYRYEMAQREDKRVKKADFAVFLVLAWELVSEGAIRRGWECYTPGGAVVLELLEAERAE